MDTFFRFLRTICRGLSFVDFKLQRMLSLSITLALWLVELYLLFDPVSKHGPEKSHPFQIVFKIKQYI